MIQQITLYFIISCLILFSGCSTFNKSIQKVLNNESSIVTYSVTMYSKQDDQKPHVASLGWLNKNTNISAGGGNDMDPYWSIAHYTVPIKPGTYQLSEINTTRLNNNLFFDNQVTTKIGIKDGIIIDAPPGEVIDLGNIVLSKDGDNIYATISGDNYEYLIKQYPTLRERIRLAPNREEKMVFKILNEKVSTKRPVSNTRIIFY